MSDSNIKIPEGWRQLSSSEVVESKDKYWTIKKTWEDVSFMVGKKVEDYLYIRKISE